MKKIIGFGGLVGEKNTKFMNSAPRVEFMRYSFTAHTFKVHTQYFHWESTVHELSSLFVQSEENSYIADRASFDPNI